MSSTARATPSGERTLRRISLPPTGWHPLSDSWLQLLRWLGTSASAVVVEIGAGNRSKIAMALSRHGFHGSLYIVDASAKACQRAAGFCRQTLPHARVVEVPRPIASAEASLPSRLDLVAGNHLLDDWVLGSTLSKEEYGQVFDHMDSKSVGATARYWRRAEQQGWVTAAVACVAGEAGALLQWGARWLAINHYRSWVHTRFGLDQADEAGLRCLHLLRSTYGNSPPFRSPSYGGGPVHWMVLDGTSGPDSAPASC
jgi:hypothetical protein